jgi:hypothetical protein
MRRAQNREAHRARSSLSGASSCRTIGLDAPTNDTELITTYVRQIEVRRTKIAISLVSEDQGKKTQPSFGP